MFEVLNATAYPNKYRVEWLGLDRRAFGEAIRGWIAQLGKPRIAGGPSSEDRRRLAQEFYELLFIYQTMMVRRYGRHYPGMDVVAYNVSAFFMEYCAKHKSGLTRLVAPPSSAAASIEEELDILSVRENRLLLKKEAIGFWMKGIRMFPSHHEGASLTFQYLGNADTAKVRLFLDVLVRDADGICRMADPRPIMSGSGSIEYGLHTAGKEGKFSSVTWTDDLFKKALKAELGASYGLMMKGKCELEFTGIKAELKADLFAGAALKGGVQGSLARDGFQGKANIEAMIGIKITSEANLDVADIFLIEASAQAFAGALARAEVEVSASYGGVTVKLNAEAFAGARIQGNAGVKLRVCGYDVIKGEAKGFLAAGAGGNFKLNFAASAFDGAELGIAAGAVLGVGAGGDASFKVYADNLSKIANTIFFSSYLIALGQTQARYTWRNYYRTLEDNEELFKKAGEIMDELIAENRRKRDAIAAPQSAWGQLEALVERGREVVAAH